MNTVCAFDFDGTLTRRDSLVEFIRFAKGDGRCLLGFLLFSPLLVMMKLHLYPNWKAKQKLFSYFFKGMTTADFNQVCEDFAHQRAGLMRTEGMECVRKKLSEGCQVAVISASIDNWVRPFFSKFLASYGSQLHILGTQIETADGVLTGRFLTPNCYGAEKVRRLNGLFPIRNSYKLIAYGDSRGDKELLDYADESFFKPFK